MVCVADGTELAAEKLDRVLTADPGMGVIRHADAGYERAAGGRCRARRAGADAGSMTVLELREIGDPVLREPAREVSAAELASAEVQALIDDMIETKRAANGAGIAAPQVGDRLRIAVAEVVQPTTRATRTSPRSR